jgi:hypothetical protein
MDRSRRRPSYAMAFTVTMHACIRRVRFLASRPDFAITGSCLPGTQLRVGRSAGAGPFLRATPEQVSATGGALFPSAHDPLHNSTTRAHCGAALVVASRATERLCCCLMLPATCCSVAPRRYAHRANYRLACFGLAEAPCTPRQCSVLRQIRMRGSQGIRAGAVWPDLLRLRKSVRSNVPVCAPHTVGLRP